jgi:DNA-binding beta-propeller fold protein YncE
LLGSRCEQQRRLPLSCPDGAAHAASTAASVRRLGDRSVGHRVWISRQRQALPYNRRSCSGPLSKAAQYSLLEMKAPMRVKVALVAAFGLGTVVIVTHFAAAATSRPVLRPETPIEVSAAPARFDLMTVDSPRRRLLAAHSRAGTLTVVDLTDARLERDVPVGRSSGVAVDPRDGKYFVGTVHGVAVVDRDGLKRTGLIETPGPADAMIFDPYNDRLYVGHDDAGELWVIDAKEDKIVGRIAIPGSPEMMAVDKKSHLLYVNIKPRNEVIAIAPDGEKIVAHWSTVPTDSLHGLALDTANRRLFVVGHSSIVSVFRLPSGKPLERIDIGPGHVDQIAFDAVAERLYCPSSGRLVSVKISAGEASVDGSIAIPAGTHSVAIDPRTHRVWIAYADANHSYVQSFVPETSPR